MPTSPRLPAANLAAFILAIVLAACAPSNQRAASDQPIVETGTLEGAPYRIDIPAGWNGGLVMLMHGYQVAGSPREAVKGLDPFATPFLDRGYAVASSDYRTQGWAVAEAMVDNERLRRHFIDRHGRPSRTLASGYSMGGHLTLATLEEHPRHYDGGLAMCPAGSAAAEGIARIIFDRLVAFAAFFPGVLPALDAPDAPAMVDHQAIEAALATREDLAAILAERFETPRQDLAGITAFAWIVLQELRQRGGGLPVGNLDERYAGFGDDVAFNAAVPRYRADPGSAAYLEANYPLDGDLEDPVVLLANVVDEIIPWGQSRRYLDLAREAGNGGLVAVAERVGVGHCSFTPEQVGASIETLEGMMQGR